MPATSGGSRIRSGSGCSRILRTDGPATASGLARTLGMNTGATSYHLRQLAEHGFIRELPARGMPTGAVVGGRTRRHRLPGGRAVEGRHRSRYGVPALGRARWRPTTCCGRSTRARRLPPEWQAAEDFSDYALTLTPAEASELTAEVHAVLKRRRQESQRGPARRAEGAARVTVQFQLFAHLDELTVP